MTAKDVLRGLFATNNYVVSEYLKDLSDSDLLIRMAPGANHIAWQLGHLISSEIALLKYLPGVAGMELPAGFAEAHTTDKSTSDTGFRTKAEYVDLFHKVRAHSLTQLDSYPEANLDNKTEGRLAPFAPTHGAMWTLIANHPMMHAGQFVVVRRKLGKPVVI